MDDQPINSYLKDLHEHVSTWHRDPDEVTEEAADHLLERCAELRREGLGDDEAVRRAIHEYGTAKEIADAHLRVARRPAIATETTRSMGVTAMFGGIGWIALPVLVAVLPDRNPSWMILASIFHLTLAMSVVGFVGLWQRHGGLGPLGYAGLTLAVLAAPFAAFTWPIPMWSMLLGAATLLLGTALLRRGIVPTTQAIALTAGLSLTGAAALGSEILISDHGEDFAFLASTAAMAAMMSGMIVFGSGLAATGRWMRSESPVERPPLPAPTR